MHTLEGQRALVTGGSRGLGLGIVEALVARGAEVTVLARSAGPLAEARLRFGVATIAGDAADPALVEATLRELSPTVLVLNAGATPTMAPLHQQSWEGFSEVWNNDVKAAFYWTQAALRLPLAPGSRVLLSSSGAAIGGSPFSGGYAGAKRMIWLMAGYANGVAKDLGLGIRFQALVLRQINGSTRLGRTAAESYAHRQGKSVEEFLASFGRPYSSREYGEHVASLLTQPEYESPAAFALTGERGIQPLDA